MAGPQNKLSDLNNHLFAQLERLGDEDMSEEETKKEIERARAITGVAKQIISNGNLVLKAAKFADEKLDNNSEVPRMLIGE
jgi:hypothetical protein